MNARSIALLSLAVASMGCHRNRAKSPGYASGPAYEAPQQGVAPTAGTCDASCSHYLQCKASNLPGAYPACVSKCQQMALTPQQLATYEATDCATAIYQAEHTGGSGAGAGTGGATPASSDCNGCAWDGSACIWLSQSNWGAGAYSGAASSCASSCCPGH